MLSIVRLLISAAFVLATTAGAAATVYKSTAPDGSTVYSDHPPADGKIEKTITFADLPSTPVPPPQPNKSEPLRKKHVANLPPRPNGDVVLYTAATCGYCKRAKAYLAQRQIGYEEVDIESPQGKVWFVKMGGGGVPLLITRGRYIRGFSADGYDAFFASR